MSTAQAMHELSDTERITIAKNKVKNEHTITECMVTPISGAVGNLGQYFYVDMTIKETSGKPEGKPQKHRFFLKTAPVDGWQVEFMIDGIFKKEANFYKELSGTLRQFLSTDVYPECFLAEPAKIVLSDIAGQGYCPLKDLTESLDYEHTKVGLKVLARLHAGGIIYEEMTGRKLGTDFPDASREVTYKPGGSMAVDFLHIGAEAMAALAPRLETNLGDNLDAVAKFQAYVVPLMDKLPWYLNEESSHRRVICHGDAWPANFMFKYDDHAKPTSALLIDFQMTRLRSPAVDVTTFLYLSVPTDDLKKWRESLLDEYYTVLAEEMRNFGIDANKIYPKAEFLQAYYYYQLTGITYGLLYSCFARVPPELLREVISTEDKQRHYYFVDRKKELTNFYKACPRLNRYLNCLTDELYENFINTTRGHTEFTR